MNRPAKFITRTIKIRIPVNNNRRGRKTRRGNRNNINSGRDGNRNKINMDRRLIPVRTLPRRSTGINYMVKNYFYKKSKKRGLPGMGMRSSHVYKYDNPVDTIFPLDNTIKDVKEKYSDAYQNRKNFKSGDQVFNYTLGDSDIKQKFLEAKELPNTNETNLNYIINQLLIPEVLRLPFMLLYDKMQLDYYKLGDETENLLKILEDDKIEEFKSKILNIEKEKQIKNKEIIEKYMDGLFTNINLDIIDKISQILEIKNIYTPQDKLKAIAKDLQTKSIKDFSDDKITTTYYKTPSQYWRNIMPVLSNYDPKEIILIATIITTQGIMFHELGIRNTISINELYMFLMTVLEIKEFKDVKMLQIRKNKELLYDLIF